MHRNSKYVFSFYVSYICLLYWSFSISRLFQTWKSTSSLILCTAWWSLFVCLFVTDEILIKVGSNQGSMAKPLSLSPRLLLSSHQHRALVCLFWSGNLTPQRIPLLLAKCALNCWMYPTAQTTLFPTPSHPWVTPEWQASSLQCGHWFTVKHRKWPQVILKTQPPICFDYSALNSPSFEVA